MISTCGVEEEVQDNKDQVQKEEVVVEFEVSVEGKLLRACAVLQAGLLVARRPPSPKLRSCRAAAAGRGKMIDKYGKILPSLCQMASRSFF